ncbi:MAG: formate dehydrogenase [Burkholderiaceae bacterium]
MSDYPTKLSRRTVFAGVGVAGAVAALTRMVPAHDPAPAAAPMPAVKPPPKRGGGYTVSEHVEQYYATARL